MPFCPYCGNKITYRTDSCPYCGRKITVVEESPQIQENISFTDFISELEYYFPNRVIDVSLWNHQRWDTFVNWYCNEYNCTPNDFFADFNFALKKGNNSTDNSVRQKAKKKPSVIRKILYILIALLNICVGALVFAVSAKQFVNLTVWSSIGIKSFFDEGLNYNQALPYYLLNSIIGIVLVCCGIRLFFGKKERGGLITGIIQVIVGLLSYSIFLSYKMPQPFTMGIYVIASGIIVFVISLIGKRKISTKQTKVVKTLPVKKHHAHNKNRTQKKNWIILFVLIVLCLTLITALFILRQPISNLVTHEENTGYYDPEGIESSDIDKTNNYNTGIIDTTKFNVVSQKALLIETDDTIKHLRDVLFVGDSVCFIDDNYGLGCFDITNGIKYEKIGFSPKVINKTGRVLTYWGMEQVPNYDNYVAGDYYLNIFNANTHTTERYPHFTSAKVKSGCGAALTERYFIYASEEDHCLYAYDLFNDNSIRLFDSVEVIYENLTNENKAYFRSGSAIYEVDTETLQCNAYYSGDLVSRLDSVFVHNGKLYLVQKDKLTEEDGLEIYPGIFSVGRDGIHQIVDTAPSSLSTYDENSFIIASNTAYDVFEFYVISDGSLDKVYTYDKELKDYNFVVTESDLWFQNGTNLINENHFDEIITNNTNVSLTSSYQTPDGLKTILFRSDSTYYAEHQGLLAVYGVPYEYTVTDNKLIIDAKPKGLYLLDTTILSENPHSADNIANSAENEMSGVIDFNPSDERNYPDSSELEFPLLSQGETLQNSDGHTIIIKDFDGYSYSIEITIIRAISLDCTATMVENRLYFSAVNIDAVFDGYIEYNGQDYTLVFENSGWPLENEKVFYGFYKQSGPVTVDSSFYIGTWVPEYDGLQLSIESYDGQVMQGNVSTHVGTIPFSGFFDSDSGLYTSYSYGNYLIDLGLYQYEFNGEISLEIDYAIRDQDWNSIFGTTGGTMLYKAHS